MSDGTHPRGPICPNIDRRARGERRRRGTSGRSRAITSWSEAIDRPFAAPDEAAAVRAVLGGDGDAYRVLVDQESAAVVRTCTRILGDLHEAEDVAQEAFVIAYRSLGSWRGDGPFGAWLARIAVRLAIRRAARRRDVAWLQPLEDSASPPAADGRVGDDPVHTALAGERAAVVRAAVARLEEPYREVIALRFFAERTLQEIAVATDRPIGTVKTHLHRGLLRLRDAFERAGRP